MKKQHKVAIGIPTYGIINWQFASSLMALQLTPETRVIWNVRSMIDTARNTLVTRALEDEKTTHLFMIDDDGVFEPDTLQKLLAHDVDIVGALMFKRRPDYEPCVFRKRENGTFEPILPRVFQEVDVIGTGCILIKMKVFKKLEFPYFSTYYDEKKIHWGVDFDFCKKATAAGFKIFCDTDVQPKHIGDPVLVGQEEFLKHMLITKKIKDEKKKS